MKFLPKGLARANQQDELKMVAAEGAKLKTNAGDAVTAHASLKDGRQLDVKAHVDASRPQVDAGE